MPEMRMEPLQRRSIRGSWPALVLLVALVAALVVLAVPGTALAADSSNTGRLFYAADNYSHGYNIFYPHNAWRGFDMVFYKEQVWQSFYTAGPTDNLNRDHLGVTITGQMANATPNDTPTQHYVTEGDETWTNTDRRITGDRLAVFRDRLFLYIAKSGDSTKGFSITQKELDGVNWAPEAVPVHYATAGINQSIRGMVVKVVDDTLLILFQKAGSRDVYLITSTNAVDFTVPQKIHTFTDDDCILNAEVVARPSDGQPLVALVTKDDATSGDDADGHMKLWTFNPSTKAVNLVWAFAHTYKDMVIVSGDVLNCTPYDRKNLQVWAVGSGTENLYHLQFTFNDLASSGACTDIYDAGNVSKHIELSNRGYLAACATAVPMTDPTTHYQSLDQRIRVWWWHDVNAAGTNAFGYSAEYRSDYLKNYGEQTIYTDKTDISDAWILQGIITGLPPYYPNDNTVGFLNVNTLLSYGLIEENEIQTTMKSAVSISVGFEQEFKKANSSIGFSVTNALERTTENEKSWEVRVAQEFGPDQQAEIPEDMGGMPLGAQAWGVFLVPDIVNGSYELWAPDWSRNLGVNLNYTYLKCSASALKVKKYDMTQRETPSVEETAAVHAYFQGENFKLFPKSTDYWLWGNDDPDYGTFVNTNPNDYYELMRVFADPDDPTSGVTVDPVNVAVDGSREPWSFLETEKTTESQKYTLKLKTDNKIFGFTLGMEGEISLESSASSSVGTELKLDYGINGWTLDQLDENGDGVTDEEELEVLRTYLAAIDFDMYWLQAKRPDAFFVPSGARIGGALPWCITWHVNGFTTGSGSHTMLVSSVRQNVSDTPQLSDDLRATLISQLEAARAAEQAGQLQTALDILGGLRDQIAAESGKGIPAQRAQTWLQVIDLIFETGGARHFSDMLDAIWIQTYGVTAEQVLTVAQGHSDGSFRPDQPVTRAQWAKMVVDGLDLPTLTPAAGTFSDVGPDHFFYRWIEGGAAAQLLRGYAGGIYLPDNHVLRQESNSILARWLVAQEIADAGHIQGAQATYDSLAAWYAAEGAAVLAGFSDAASVAEVHRATTAYLVMRGVVMGASSGGMTTLQPLSDISRAQAAVMVLRALAADQND